MRRDIWHIWRETAVKRRFQHRPRFSDIYILCVLPTCQKLTFKASEKKPEPPYLGGQQHYIFSPIVFVINVSIPLGFKKYSS